MLNKVTTKRSKEGQTPWLRRTRKKKHGKKETWVYTPPKGTASSSAKEEYVVKRVSQKEREVG